MSYDEKLASRIRETFAHHSNVKERHMMGGISFIINGKMCVRAHRNKELMLRCEPAMTDQLLLKNGAKRFEMKGRSNMKGWLIITPEGLSSKDDFDYWMNVAIGYNAKLNALKPQKQKS